MLTARPTSSAILKMMAFLPFYNMISSGISSLRQIMPLIAITTKATTPKIILTRQMLPYFINWRIVRGALKSTLQIYLICDLSNRIHSTVF